MVLLYKTKPATECVNLYLSLHPGSFNHSTDDGMGPPLNCSSKVSKFFSTPHNDVKIITVSKLIAFMTKFESVTVEMR